jgi:hypothetical protein
MKKDQKPQKKVKVIRIVQEGSAYGYQICDVDESALTIDKKSDPEVFFIFKEQIIEAIRDLLDI